MAAFWGAAGCSVTIFLEIFRMVWNLMILSDHLIRLGYWFGFSWHFYLIPRRSVGTTAKKQPMVFCGCPGSADFISHYFPPITYFKSSNLVAWPWLLDRKPCQMTHGLNPKGVTWGASVTKTWGLRGHVWQPHGTSSRERKTAYPTQVGKQVH